MTDTSNNQLRHGFSVGTLLLLTAVVAIGMAGVRTLVMSANETVIEESRPAVSSTQATSTLDVCWAQQKEEATMRGAAGIMIGLLVGFGIGITRPRRLLGVLLSVGVGAVVGGVAGGVLTQRENLSVVLIGSAVLFTFGGVIYTLSSRGERPSAAVVTASPDREGGEGDGPGIV